MQIRLTGLALGLNVVWGAPDNDAVAQDDEPPRGSMGVVAQAGTTLHFIDSNQYLALNLGADGAAPPFPFANPAASVSDLPSTNGDQSLVYPQPLAEPSSGTNASQIELPINLTHSALVAPIPSLSSTQQPFLLSQPTVAPTFVWSTNTAGIGSMTDIPIAPHLQDPVDIATNFSSAHVGFETPDIATEINLWNTSQTAADLVFDLENRLQRAQSSQVPGQSGYLPVEYFDEPVAPPPVIPWSVPRDSYIPYVITDEELLAEQTIALSPYVQMPKDVTMYCYPFGEEEINGKCLTAMEDFGATAVYLPMMAEIGTERSKTYYEAVRQLKKTMRKDGKRYKIVGVAYDNPNWALITQVRKKIASTFLN